MRASFFVAGAPAPKGSRIPGTRKDGSHFSRPASKGEMAWTEAVAYTARVYRPGGKPLEPPYEVELTLSLPRPQRPVHAWPTKQDGDKLERCVNDGLVKGGLLVDDRHIVSCHWRKVFAEPGRESGVTIQIA